MCIRDRHIPVLLGALIPRNTVSQIRMPIAFARIFLG
jgi:hypothetical protein